MVKVREYLDRFFAGYEMTQELYDLKDEITMNAADRYRDYIDAGYTAEEAEEMVLKSLGDLKELMKEVNAKELQDDLSGIFSNVITSLFGKRREKIVDVEQSFEGIREIVIEVPSADIEFKRSDDEKVYVEAHGSYAMLKVEEDEGKLTLKEDGRSIVSFGGIEDMTLCLPEGIEKIDVNVVNGDIQADDIGAEDIRISTVNGDVDLRDLSFERLNIHTVNGDAEVETDSAFDSIIYESVNGDLECRLHGVEGVDLHTESISGDVECDLPHDPSHIIRVTTVSGDVSITE